MIAPVRTRGLVGGLCLAALLATAATYAPAGGPPRLPKRPPGTGAPTGPKRNLDYDITVSPGIGGFCRLGWFPVHVAIDAKRDFEGEIVAVLRGRQRGPALYETRRKVQLAAGSKKDYHLYLRHESPHIGTQQGVQIYLYDGRMVEGTSRFRNIRLVPKQHYLVCVVSDRPGLLRGIAGQNRRAKVNKSLLEGGYSREFKVAQPDLRELPDRSAGYTGVDFVVMYQTPLEVSKLSPDALDAIVDYARGGGVVVLASGDRDWFARRALQPLAPIRKLSAMPKKDSVRLLSMLGNRYGTGFGSRATGMSIHDLEVAGFAFDRGRGFSVGRCGLGTTLIWQLDPRDPSVRNWPGLYSLWADLGRQYYREKPRDDWGYGFGTSEQNNPVVRARVRVEQLNMAKERSVSAFLVVFIVVFYLVLVGPVNYFVLRRLDMRALSIVTIPLLSAVFVLITFAVGYISRGVTTVGRRVTVATIPSGAARASCVTCQSIFPSGSMLVDVGTDARGLVCPLLKPQMVGGQQEKAFAVMSDEGYVLERHPMRMWEMAFFEAVSSRRLGGSVRLHALVGAEGRLDGSFKMVNMSSVKLTDAFVVSSVAGGRYAWIGDVQKGKAYSGKVTRWQQVGGRRTIGRYRRAPGLTLRNALILWIKGDLKNALSHRAPQPEDGFADQAAGVIIKDPRLSNTRFAGRPGMLLFAKVERIDEFEPIRLDGGSVRGEAVNVLVVFAERGGAK
jgi:hypothetical protein